MLSHTIILVIEYIIIITSTRVFILLLIASMHTTVYYSSTIIRSYTYHAYCVYPSRSICRVIVLNEPQQPQPRLHEVGVPAQLGNSPRPTREDNLFRGTTLVVFPQSIGAPHTY